MFRKVLVPLDGSPFAERALSFAEALAKRGGGQVLLVNAASATVLPGIESSSAQVKAVQEGKSYLADVAGRLKEQGIEVETAVPYGSPSDAIVTEIEVRNADLVLMATHGRSGLGRWVYGSVAEAVLHSSPVPVMLVQSWQGEAPWRDFLSHPRLLVPLDGSVFGEAAVGPAANLAREIGGELILMQAISLAESVVRTEGGGILAPAVPIGEKLGEYEENARAYLHGVAQRVNAEFGVEARLEIGFGEPTETIASVAQQLQATLVVMSTHGRTGMARAVFGSVAAGVLRTAIAPLLLVRPTGITAAAQQLATTATAG